MKTITMVVNKRENKAFVPVGSVEIVVPVLADIAGAVAGAQVTGEEDGLPVYSDDIANWVQSAIYSTVKAAARNKLENGTATVKAGLKIATNWEELTAEADRSGGAAALALLREFRAQFETWVKTLGKSEAAQATLVKFVGNRTALELADANVKSKIKGYVEQFADALSESEQLRFERPLMSLLETCESASLDDF